MTFALSDELNDSIISAMENQDEKFLLDAQAEQLIKVSQNPLSADDNNYYEIPEWTPSDGYSVRESFVNNLHSPLAKEELQEILHSGRGVFKNFRNVLKKYPEIDKRWHIYKYRIMSARINDWYNSLREIWGLEKLEQFQESDESFVSDDFSFDKYDSKKEKDEILLHINAALYEKDDNIPEEIKEAITQKTLNQLEKQDFKEEIGFICRSLSDDFAGCITASPILENQEEIMVLTSLFVPEAFRGLGIATELISRLFSELQTNGKKWILMPIIITPELLEPLLTRMGFKKIRYGYMAEIL
ncbi:MAG: GNAT family N-acetyltransferase [Treponema sp.]|nr:GNAT family N-acetyltransferase [Treponema sp.]